MGVRPRAPRAPSLASVARGGSTNSYPATGTTNAGGNGWGVSAAPTSKLVGAGQPFPTSSCVMEVVTSGGLDRPPNEIGKQAASRPRLIKVPKNKEKERDTRPDAQKTSRTNGVEESTSPIGVPPQERSAKSTAITVPRRTGDHYVELKQILILRVAVKRQRRATTR